MTNNKINNAKITSIAIASILLIGSLSMTSTAFAHSQSSSITFGYDANPVSEGTPVEMSGVATADLQPAAGGPNVEHPETLVDGGNVQIRIGVDAFDNPVSVCGTEDDWEIIDTVTTNASGEYSYNFSTDGLGGQTLVFQARYTGGTNDAGHNIVQSQSICIPLEITLSECEGDIQIAAIDSSVDPENGIFGYTIEVTACTDVEDLKIQGGSNGWSSINSFEETPEIGVVDIKELKKNTVYSWKIPELSENDMVSFEVELTSNIEISCGQTVQINGAWSVAYKLPEDNTKYKTGYSSPLTWTNVCPPV